ncbi:54S ribosomal protein L4, mitochondrial [Hondaea fermentalgiana]|uniref:Large ribosomal subunit protein uL29m n=1 Tax=Hondaea fermentalgiana TaxID=2315210 RepID=A0A2R5GKS1_9STRA|nr:54S ribosomal protein L4, mitochondrial [Hondaea fermentalgiana]|eukprot:GBG31506.1 54S ribosomal protein L4, mitochondrial [Hondaea fermentalgiana]
MLRAARAAGALAGRRPTVGARPAAVTRGIEEFFDVRGEKSTDGTVETGRAWTADELRLKSFDDLRKLWFILLKEKNMLLTEKHLARSMGQPMVGADRIRKVKTSMARLKTVVNERSRVYKANKELEDAEKPSLEAVDNKA